MRIKTAKKPMARAIVKKTVRCATAKPAAKKETANPSGVIVEDIDSCMIKFSKCCTPVPGDVIVGYGSSGHAMLYIGDGYILDCRGGKYDRELGTGKITEDHPVPPFPPGRDRFRQRYGCWNR